MGIILARENFDAEWEQEYHRRRTEMELEQAVEADALEIAAAHLELARMHRAQRQAIAARSLEAARRHKPPRIMGADKEA